MPRIVSNRINNFLAFNGSSDFLTLPITPSVTGFNIAFFAIMRNFTNNARIVDWQNGGPTNGFTILELGNGVIESNFRQGATINAVLDTKALPNGKLVHVTITHDGTIGKLYINGSLLVTDTTSAIDVSSATLTIGKRFGGANYWNGKMAELVFHNTTTPWTATQVSNLYFNGNIPSGASYWLFNGNVLDGSGNGNHGTLTGGTYDYRATPRLASRFQGGSTLFNGSTSVIKMSSRPIYNLVNYSVSFWINAVEQADDKYFLTNGNSATGVQFWGLDYKKPAGTSYNLRLFIRDDSNASLVSSDITPQNLVHGKWYHVVITDVGGSAKAYINGVYQGINLTYTRGTLTLDQTSFGALWRNNTSNYFTGKLTEVKIFNSVLTNSQIQTLYTSGSCGVTPVASYALDDQPSTYIDSIAANNGIGTATTYSPDIPVQQRVVVSDYKASLLFGAALTDRVNLGTSDIVGTGNISMSAWVKLIGWGGNNVGRIFDSSNLLFYVNATGGKVFFERVAGTSAASESNSIVLNKWIHILVTSTSAGVSNIYINGKLSGGANQNAGAPVAYSNPVIGNRNDNDRNFNGYIIKFCIFGKVLTAQEARDLYFSSVIPSGSTHSYLLGEGAGSIAYDSVGTSNGTITGATWSSDTPSKRRRNLLKYSHTFGDDLTGKLPSYFTKVLKPGETAVYTVDETVIPTGSVDTKSLKISMPTGGNINIIVDKRVLPGKDLTIQADIRFSAIGSDGNAGKIGILGRVSLGGMYVAYIKPNGNLLRVSKLTGVGALSETVIQSVTIPNFTATVDTWYTIKFQLSSTALRAKIWPTGTTEPVEWQIDTTDATYITGNMCGIWSYDGVEVCNSYVTNFKSTDENIRNIVV